MLGAMDERDRLVAALERLIVAGGSITSRAIVAAAPGEADLSVAQYRALVHVLGHPDGIRIGELARLGGTTSQAATRLVQRLEAAGLVRLRRGEERDRRLVLAEATPEARRRWNAISRGRRSGISSALEFAGLAAEVAGPGSFSVDDGARPGAEVQGAPRPWAALADPGLADAVAALADALEAAAERPTTAAPDALPATDVARSRPSRRA